MQNENKTKTALINLIGLFGGAIIGGSALRSLVFVYVIATGDPDPGPVIVNGSGLALLWGAPVGGILGILISNSLFKTGVKIKHIAILFGMINIGINLFINHLYNQISPPLLRAVSSNRIALLQSAIRRGADLNVKNGTALSRASYHGYLDIVKTLVNAGADINTGALASAVGGNHLPIIMFLIEEGADVNYQDSNGWTALMSSARDNNTTVLNILIDKDADIKAQDVNGRTALMEAVKGQQKIHPNANQVATIKTLIQAGADVNARDINRQTVLMSASEEPIIKTLIQAGADVNARDLKGKTALMSANINEESVIRTLIQAGADVNARDLKGKTALIYAVRRKNPAVVKTLIQVGADVNIKDFEGKTALMSAVEKTMGIVKVSDREEINIELAKRWD